MPYPNEHSARIKDPSSFEQESFRRKNIAGGIDIIIGKLKSGDGSMVTQAYRFDKSTFTADEAKKWLKDHNISYISFEAAREQSGEKTFRELRFDVSANKFIEQNGTLLVKDVKLLASGTWTDSHIGTPLFYPESTLEKSAGNWIDNSLWSRHSGGAPRSITDKIGEVRNPRYNAGAVLGDLFLHGKTQASRDTMELIKSGMVNFVSVEHGGKERYNSAEKRYEAEDIVFGGVAVVNRGACAVCTIQNESGLTEGTMEPTKDDMKAMLAYMKSHPDMVDDAMKGMMKSMMGDGKMMESQSLSAEAGMMDQRELEAKIAESEKRLKELQDASASKDQKISELESKLGKFKELESRIEKIEKTPIPNTQLVIEKELEYKGPKVIVDTRTGEVYGVN